MAGRLGPGLRGWRWPYTPISPRGRTSLDHLPPEEALARAWSKPGPRPRWHAMMQQVVRDCMPLVARALDRLADDR